MDAPTTRLRIEPATPDQVNAVLQHPVIAPKLRHSDREPGYIEHPLVSYTAAYVGDDLAGIFTAVQFTSLEVETHVAILPFAIRHARALSRLFLAQVFADPAVERATAYVIGTLPSATNLCRRLGYVDEGRRRNAVRIDGALCDVIMLGLTRNDWLANVGETK